MTNNYDNNENEHGDFVEPEHGISEEGARPGVTGNLSEAWRTKPMFKFMVLVAAVFVVGVIGMNFLGGGSSSSDSAMRLGKPPALKQAPGGTDSPYMLKQTDMADKERTDQALANGGSAIPTPRGQSVDTSDFSDKKEDPLKELRAETEKLQKQVQQQQVQQQQQTQQQNPQRQEQFDNSLSEAMQRQMQQLLEGWSPKGIKNVTVIKAEDLTKASASSESKLSAEQDAQNSAALNKRKIIVNAGTVNYGQLLTEANSDVPGPILAQIVSGPLAGARAVGSFQVSEGYEKYLVLRFSLADKKGVDYQINAIALDPDTTLGGMATEVDERYFARVILPAAAGFLQGMGQALGQGNSSITTNGTETIATTTANGYKQGIYQGMGTAAQTMSQFFQNQANLTKPLVRVAAGSPIGIFYITPVLEPSSSAPLPATPNGNGNGMGMGNGNGYNNGYSNGNVNGNGNYPGTTVNGYGSNNTSSGLPYPNYANPSANRLPINGGFGGFPSTAYPSSGYNSGYGQ